MSAFNVVRFRVKAGQETRFLEEHRNMKADFPGLVRAALVKTGERAYCFIGEWNEKAGIERAEKAMVANLDRFRHTLEDLGHGLGVTDPVSGEVVLQMKR